jgi:hypothetical protein
MGGRWYNVGVIVFWLASISWLCGTKIVPLVGWSDPGPGETPMVPGAHEGRAAVGWEVRWQSRPIGWAVYRLEPQPNGVQQAHSVVHFDDLPVGPIARELFGPLAQWINSDWDAESHLPAAMRVDTRMTFDRMADSQSFISTVHFGEIRELVTLTGMAVDGKLQVVASAAESFGGGPGKPARRELYRGEVELPARMSVAGTLSPVANLRNLRVGQEWMFQAYRPVPFRRPLQLARAEVEGEEVLDWQGQRCFVRHVVLRQAQGASPSAAQEPFGQLWVQRDGTVLKQRLRLANLTIDLIRLPKLPRQFQELR